MNKFLFLFSVAVIFALINSNEASDVAEAKQMPYPGYPYPGYPGMGCTLREHCWPACCWGNGYCGACSGAKEGSADYKEEIKVELEEKDMKAIRFLNQVKGAKMMKEAKEVQQVAKEPVAEGAAAENKNYWNDYWNGYAGYPYNGWNWPHAGWNNGWNNGWNWNYPGYPYQYGWCRARSDCGAYCCWGNGYCGACGKEGTVEAAGNSTSFF